MANRNANGDRIYNEPWKRRTREVFYWLLFSGSDSLGMQGERPGVAAAMLSENDPDDPITTQQVQECIEVLCSGPRPALVRYTADGRSYLIFRKWQEWQRIYFNVEPTCPLPDDETLKLLSDATRKLIEDNYTWSITRTTERLQKKIDRKDEATSKELASNSQVKSKSLAPTGTGTVSVTASGSVNKDNGKNGLVPVADAPEPRPTWPAESLALKSIPGYPFDEEKDRPLFDLLADTYQQLDLAAEVKKCHAWLLRNNLLPLKGVAGPRKRIHTWIEKADSYGRNDGIGKPNNRQTPGPPRRHAPATAADFGEGGIVNL